MGQLRPPFVKPRHLSDDGVRASPVSNQADERWDEQRREDGVEHHSESGKAAGHFTLSKRARGRDAMAGNAHRHTARLGLPNAQKIEHVGPTTAPMMPVRIVSAAVRAGTPPISRDISNETAVVADFGASDKTVEADACANIATDRPTRMLATEPANSAAPMRIQWSCSRRMLR